MRNQKQNGMILVLGMIFLTIASLLAVSSMRSSNIQEKITANQRNKNISLMAAESGTNKFIKWIRDTGFNPSTWQTAITGISINKNTPTKADNYGFFWVEIPNPNSTPLTVLIHGLAMNDSGSTTLAQSTIELRIEITGGTPRGGGLGGAINFFGNVSKFDGANSNSYTVNGNGGPAIGASTEQNRQTIEDDINNKGRLNNYIGGIAQVAYPEPWSDASKMKSLVDAICASADYCGNNANSLTYGSPNDRKVNVLTGNQSISFNGNKSGAGILVVTGTLTFSGTPSWDGVIIALGGAVNTNGGGNGGLEGTLFIANMNTSGSTWSFNSTGSSFNVNGGGTADYNYNCDSIYNSRALLNATAKSLWSFDQNECTGTSSGSGTGGSSTGTQTIISWQEKS